MKTILILGFLAVIILVVIILIKKFKKPTTTTITTTNETTDSTTDSTVRYYSLYKCEPNGSIYYTGPYPIGHFSSGDRVEGATDTYYTVTGSQDVAYDSPYIYIGVSSTGFQGCP